MTMLISTVQQALEEFVLNFIERPYLAYTEHGLHALFFTALFNRLPPQDLYTEWGGREVCVIQKEYPTACALGKPQRQHWDIAVLKTPAESACDSYDYLKLAAVVEFGMNEAEPHLLDDLERLSHPGANVDHAFAVHLYRLSRPGAPFSGRDWSAKSARIVTPERIAKLTEDKTITAYYALHDDTGKYPTAAYRIQNGSASRLGQRLGNRTELNEVGWESENRETDIITACALRFNGYAYAEDHGLIRTGEDDSVDPPMPYSDYSRVLRDFLDNPDWSLPRGYLLMILFLLQRGLIKEGWLRWDSHEAKVVRMLFLETCRDEMPSKYQIPDIYDQWQRQYRPYLDEYVRLIEHRHRTTLYTGKAQP